MRSRLTAAVGGLAVALLVGGTSAGAQPPTPEGPEGWGRGGPRMLARVLGLSDEQQTQVRQVFEQHRPQMQAMHEQMRDNRTRLQEALASPQPDPTTVGEIVIEEHQLREKSRALREEIKKSIDALLSPEQKSKEEILEQARTLVGPKGRFPMGPDGPGMGPRGWSERP
jgi:Spy/CpxP family protein refolding chaperone